jgi:hypothetical protein
VVAHDDALRKPADGAMAATRAIARIRAAFDLAFSDRFGGRDVLVRLHHGTLLRMFASRARPR